MITRFERQKTQSYPGGTARISQPQANSFKAKPGQVDTFVYGSGRQPEWRGPNSRQGGFIQTGPTNGFGGKANFAAVAQNNPMMMARLQMQSNNAPAPAARIRVAPPPFFDAPPKLVKQGGAQTFQHLTQLLYGAFNGSADAKAGLARLMGSPEELKWLKEQAAKGDRTATETLNLLARTSPDEVDSWGAPILPNPLTRRLAVEGLGAAVQLTDEQMDTLWGNVDGRFSTDKNRGGVPDFGAQVYARNALKAQAERGNQDIIDAARQMANDPRSESRDAAFSVLAKAPELSKADLDLLTRDALSSADSTAFYRMNGELVAGNKDAVDSVKSHLRGSLKEGQADRDTLRLLTGNPQVLDQKDIPTLLAAGSREQKADDEAARALAAAASQEKPLPGAHQALLQLASSDKAGDGAKQVARDYITKYFQRCQDGKEKAAIAHHVAHNPFADKETTLQAVAELQTRVSKEDPEAVAGLISVARREKADEAARIQAVKGLEKSCEQTENRLQAIDELKSLYLKGGSREVRSEIGTSLVSLAEKGDSTVLGSLREGLKTDPNRAESLKRLGQLLTTLKPDDPRRKELGAIMVDSLARWDKSGYSPVELDTVFKTFDTLRRKGGELEPSEMKALADATKIQNSTAAAKTYAEALRGKDNEQKNKLLDQEMAKLAEKDGLWENRILFGELAGQLRVQDIKKLAGLLKSDDEKTRAATAQILSKGLLDGSPGDAQLEIARQLGDNLRDLPQEVQNKLTRVAGQSQDNALKEKLLKQLPSKGITRADEMRVAEKTQEGLSDLLKRGAEGQISDPALARQVETYTKYLRALDLAQKGSRETAINIDIGKLRELKNQRLPELLASEPLAGEIRRIGERASDSSRYEINKATAYLKSDDFQNRLNLMSPEERQKAKLEEFGRLGRLDPKKAEEAWHIANVKETENFALERMSELGLKDPQQLANLLNGSGQALGQDKDWTAEEARELAEQIKKHGSTDTVERFTAKLNETTSREELKSKLATTGTYSNKADGGFGAFDDWMEKRKVKNPNLQTPKLDRLRKISQRLKGPAAALAFVASVGSVSMSRWDNPLDVANNLGDIATAVNSLEGVGKLSALVAKAPKFARFVGVAGKVAGPVGTVIGMGVDGYGCYRAAERGDTGGALGKGTSVVGGGIMLTAPCWGPGAPVAFLIGLGVWGVGQGIDYFFGDSEEEAVLREAGIHN